MRALGRALGSVLGETSLTELPGPLLIALQGDLGAGKTTFVSGVLNAVGVAGPVRSPTYTLIEPYETATRTLYHLDLYRLVDPREVAALGVRDLLTTEAVLLVEWPERAAGALPDADLSVSIQYPDAPPQGRQVTLSGREGNGVRLLAALLERIHSSGA